MSVQEIYYPRAAGKWSKSLELLREAWKQGQETLHITGSVYNIKQHHGKGICPVCGQSVHTATHAEVLRKL